MPSTKVADIKAIGFTQRFPSTPLHSQAYTLENEGGLLSPDYIKGYIASITRVSAEETALLTLFVRTKMKCKLIKFLTVCFVTLAVISPGILVFSFVWEQHKSLVQKQHVACEVTHSSTDDILSPQVDPELERNKASIKKFDFDIVKLLTYIQQYQIFKITQWILLLFPLILVISIIVYDKYLIYRATIFQQQVEMLEKLWQHSIEQ